MIRANKLNQLLEPRNVGKFDRNGEFSESGDFGEMITASKLTQLEEPRNVGEFGENGEFGKSGDFGEISPRLLSK